MIYGITTGIEWQKICNKIFCMHYENEVYQTVPDTVGGDLGIEGYTRTGKVFQCYFPEGNYSAVELNDHLQNKMTTDIGKLVKNKDEFAELLKGIQIHQWIFVIPEYKDKKLLKHAIKKKEEIIANKKNEKLCFIADDFDVIIYHEDHYAVEFKNLMSVDGIKVDLTNTKYESFDWTNCDAELVKNIERKIRAILPNSVDDATSLISFYVDYYAKGLSQLTRLQKINPGLFEEFKKIARNQEKEMFVQCKRQVLNNNELFYKLLDDFENSLKERLNKDFDNETLDELKNHLVSDWLMRCPMDFK